MRTDKLNDQVQAAWDHVFNHMYHEETGIVFDYRTSTDPDGAFSHLPIPVVGIRAWKTARFS